MTLASPGGAPHSTQNPNHSHPGLHFPSSCRKAAAMVQTDPKRGIVRRWCRARQAEAPQKSPPRPACPIPGGAAPSTLEAPNDARGGLPSSRPARPQRPPPCHDCRAAMKKPAGSPRVFKVRSVHPVSGDAARAARQAAPPGALRLCLSPSWPARHAPCRPRSRA